MINNRSGWGPMVCVVLRCCGGLWLDICICAGSARAFPCVLVNRMKMH